MRIKEASPLAAAAALLLAGLAAQWAQGVPASPPQPRPAAKPKASAKGCDKPPPGVNLFGMRGYPPPAEVNDPAKFFPLIDTFGQYIHRNWPGKTHAQSDLDDARTEEAKDLRARPGPKNWDKYGGWKDGPALKATGFFRVEKREGKWWLVDPEGRLFWSHGIDCVDESSNTPIDDRKDWFQDFPGDRPEFNPLLGRGRSIKGYYAGRTVRTFDFGAANLFRKYGNGYKQAAGETAHKRLRSWGMNTIANWSDAGIYLMRKTPYTATIHFGSRPIAGSAGYWGQFKDPFDPQFAAAARAAMARETRTGDPWCLGYFVDNEMSWGDDTSLAVAALASPPDQAAKKAFLEDLKAKYGDIAKLNAAWGTAHASWEALAASTAPPDKKKAAEDLGAFHSRIAEQYFKTVRDAVKAVAPNQLYLGCRFAWVNDRAVVTAAKYCDVVSYNRYRRTADDFRLPEGLDKPVVIGEFHFGALDRGMFHTGLVPTASQAERAAAYKAYVEGALANPAIVGTHWFQYRDEPTTGRPLDEENYQIGFVDVCDRHYPETIAACREVGYDLYRFRARGK